MTALELLAGIAVACALFITMMSPIWLFRARADP